jgi:hypothetical protein
MAWSPGGKRRPAQRDGAAANECLVAKGVVSAELPERVHPVEGASSERGAGLGQAGVEEQGRLRMLPRRQSRLVGGNGVARQRPRRTPAAVVSRPSTRSRPRRPTRTNRLR